jgi:hypothetical protein
MKLHVTVYLSAALVFLDRLVFEAFLAETRIAASLCVDSLPFIVRFATKFALGQVIQIFPCIKKQFGE